MAGYWAPWPAKSQTRDGAVPDVELLSSRPSLSPRRAAAIDSSSGATTTTRRCSSWGRPLRKVKATSTIEGFEFSTASARSVRRRSAALEVLAETINSCGRVGAGVGSTWGASSSTAWAFVPPMPKALTPARRGVEFWGQGRSLSLTKNGLLAKSISGFG